MNLKNLEKKKDEEIQAKKTEINNMAIEKKKLIAEFEETKKLTAGMKDSVRKADIFTLSTDSGLRAKAVRGYPSLSSWQSPMLKFYFLLNSFKAAIENARVKLEDAIEIDTVDEVPQTPRTAEPRTAEPKTPHGPKFDEGLFAPTNLSK